MEETENNTTSIYATMLGSASAGMISRVFCHPLDTAKARLQAQFGSAANDAKLYRNTFDVLKRTISLEGFFGLYRGFTITMLGSAPATCLYLTSYEYCKSKLFQVPVMKESPFLVHFSAGMAAEAVSCVFWVPIDVVKERMQVQQQTKVTTKNTPLEYRNTLQAIRLILKNEGISGIYKGYGATLMSFGPFSALYFLFYEKTKIISQHYCQVSSVSEIPFPLIMASSACAGAAASFCTNPLDLVKLRLQIQRGQLAKSAGETELRTHYTSFLHGLNSVLRYEGIRGLFKGAGARMAFHAPSTAITMSLYERCKDFFADHV